MLDMENTVESFGYNFLLKIVIIFANIYTKWKVRVKFWYYGLLFIKYSCVRNIV